MKDVFFEWVCVCVCVCVCEHECVTMSVLTHLLLNHKSASLLFPLYPLDSFSTSHHSNFPDTRTSSFFHFHFFVYVFSSFCRSQSYTMLCWSQLCLFIFSIASDFSSVSVREKVQCCCYQVKQIQKWINFPLNLLLSQSTLLRWPCGPQTVWRATVCCQQCCVTHKIVILTCGLQSIWSAFVNKIENLNPTWYTTLEKNASPLTKMIHNIILKLIMSVVGNIDQLTDTLKRIYSNSSTFWKKKLICFLAES